MMWLVANVGMHAAPANAMIFPGANAASVLGTPRSLHSANGGLNDQLLPIEHMQRLDCIMVIWESYIFRNLQLNTPNSLVTHAPSNRTCINDISWMFFTSKMV